METKIRDIEIDPDTWMHQLVDPEDVDTLGELYYENRRYISQMMWDTEDPGLRSFIVYFSPSSKRELHTIHLDVLGEMKRIGFFWIYNLNEYKCDAGFLINRKFWGKCSDVLVRNISHKLHETLGIEYIFAFTPWVSAARMCKRAGFTACAKLPKFNNGRDVLGFFHKE